MSRTSEPNVLPPTPAARAAPNATGEPPSGARLRTAALIFAGFIVTLVVVGAVPRWFESRAATVESAHNADEPFRVVVIHPAKLTDARDILLPGSISALQETVVYARTSGYVRKWLVDIGADVKEGDTLALIDTPEINQELAQARAIAAQAEATVQQSKSQLDFAAATLERYKQLSPTGVISKEDLEEKQTAFLSQQSALLAAQAALANSRANEKRLVELTGFAKVTAPFAGVVTSRTTENGQLVVAGTSNGQPLFKVAAVDVVRVFINVPQLYAHSIKPGDKVPVSVREYPGQTFAGVISHTAQALDPQTRTMLAEIRIDNPGRKLFNGMYAQVHLAVVRPAAPLVVPTTAVLSDSRGTNVAVVQDGLVHLRKVEIDSDLGDRMAIASGVSENDLVVATLSERLGDGQKVVASDEKALK